MLEDEPDMAVVGEAGDGEEAIKLARELKPKVVVMDCALPTMNGLDATRQILEDLPETAVLMLSMHSESTWVRQAIEAGAKGYILKNAMNLELGPAVRRVAGGETIFDPQEMCIRDRPGKGPPRGSRGKKTTVRRPPATKVPTRNVLVEKTGA